VAVTASGGQEGNRMIWWVAGAALVGLLLIVAYPVLQGDDGPAAPTGVAPSSSMPGAGASSVDLSSMTPREAADRLYDRVMRADAAGDTAQIFSFLPMAIAAYDRAQPLDPDGFYHLAVLKQTAADFEGALAAAQGGLAESPDHLLNLIAAARAQHALGDLEGARQRYSRLLEVWDEQQASGLEDYAAHAGQLPEFRSEAESFLEQ
jgi:tetratricopeptide (TPR) repeat protein